MSTPKERELAEEAKRFYELKQKVVKYYQNNGVPKKMEDVLNDMYYDNPVDVYGYLSNVFANHSKPSSVSKVKAREVLDSKGQPTLQTDVHCTVKNVEKIVASSVVSSYGYVLDGAKVEEKDEEDKWRQEMITAALELINGELSDKLHGMDPTKQRDADNMIIGVIERLRNEEAERVALEKAAEAAGRESPAKAEEDKAAKKAPPSPKKGGGNANRSKAGKSPQGLILPDEPREVFVKGSNSLSALSQALCQAGAKVQDIPIYQHIAQTGIGETVKKFKLPLPMVTLIQAGRASAGKFRGVKDFMIVPSPTMSMIESIKYIGAIYSSVLNSLVTKYGPGLKNTSDTGALCPALEKVEQGLDALQEGITSVGLTPGTHFNIVLNCAAQELFDLEKGKYEVTVGGLKGPEDMVDFWVDLLHRYPAINGLIDPLRKRDTEQWNKLCEKVSAKCYVIGDAVYHRPGLLKSEEVNKEMRTSGVVLRMEQMNTVSDIIACAQKMEETSNQIVLSTCQGETTDDFLADLAVGVGARFLKTGAPCRGERVSKLNRLLQIEDILASSDCLESRSDHVYPDLTAPPPADVQIVEEEKATDETSEADK